MAARVLSVVVSVLVLGLAGCGQSAPDALARAADLYDAGKLEEALVALNKAAKGLPSEPAVFLLRGRTYARLLRHAEAMKDLRRAIQLAPDDPEVLNELAWLLATSSDGRFRDGQEALKHAKKACELSPTAHRFDTLAAAYAEIGNFAEAVQWQEKAVANPDKDLKTDLPGARKRLQYYKEKKPWREK